MFHGNHSILHYDKLSYLPPPTLGSVFIWIPDSLDLYLTGSRAKRPRQQESLILSEKAAYLFMTADGILNKLSTAHLIPILTFKDKKRTYRSTKQHTILKFEVNSSPPTSGIIFIKSIPKTFWWHLFVKLRIYFPT